MFTLLALPIPVIAALVSIHCHGATLPANIRLLDNDEVSAVHPDGQTIKTFIVSPAAIAGGSPAKATIHLRYPAPAGGFAVDLTSNDKNNAAIPQRVVIPEGRSSVQFEVKTRSVTSLQAFSISATSQANNITNTVTVLPPARHRWYVSPNGKKSGTGTADSPWDLATALAQAAVKPGDTVWLMAGRYAGTFLSTLAGTPDAPIIVRAMPNERVIIDKAQINDLKQPALKVKGPWVWFWDIEVTNSNADRKRNSPYSGTDEPWRGSGVDVYAPNVKFINMVFHDNGHGIWDKEDMTEIHGCLFFFNGNNKREHAMYIGNSSGTKFITDNVVFDQAGYGILAYSNSTKSAQKGLHIEGNVTFNNGMLTADDQKTGNLQVGGVSGVSAERIVIRNNFVYNTATNAATKNNGIRLGYEDTGNKDVKVLDNYVVSNNPFVLRWWQDVEFKGNSIYSDSEMSELTLPPGGKASQYRWDFNSYLTRGLTAAVFRDDSGKLSFLRWRELTGLDLHSEARRAAGVQVFVRPNRYEAGRANIMVYNWDAQNQVAVDLSAVLQPGMNYEIRDAQNYFGEPVVRGQYKGGSISLPMHLTARSRPVGTVERVPGHTSSEFGIFIVRVVGSSKSAFTTKA